MVLNKPMESKMESKMSLKTFACMCLVAFGACLTVLGIFELFMGLPKLSTQEITAYWSSVVTGLALLKYAHATVC